MKSVRNIKHIVTLGFVCICLSNLASAFESGSTGADGVFEPASDVELVLPFDGIFNFVSVNIPVGVTVTFQKNANNTPVIWLVQQSAVIDGVVELSGIAGEAGPGGFNGGIPGSAGGSEPPGFGLGPGGGESFDANNCYGTGGGYGTEGLKTNQGGACPANVGGTYGRPEIIPLVGGSGGGGGARRPNGDTGLPGGGGGGAILIAASGTITINGTINANGGPTLAGSGSCGGHGSGGAIKLMASTIEGNGPVNANQPGFLCAAVAPGGAGRIRLEAEVFNRTSPTNPPASIDLPGPIFVPNFPTLAITEVAGLTVPANPTGMNDVQIPASTLNPVNVIFSTVNVPLGSNVDLKVIPFMGTPTSATSGAITGTEANGTASASIDLPEGSSTLQASVTFTIDSTAGLQYAPFADGQVVAKIRSSYQPGIGSVTTLITENGQEFDWPSSEVQVN